MSKTLWSVLVLIIVIIVPWQLGWFNHLPATPDMANNQADKSDLIIITSPLPRSSITSPLTLTGTARGYWFFEATAPVTLITEQNGVVLAESYITATDPWMTEDFVNFTGRLEFEPPTEATDALLVFKKDNPSGLPEHDDEFVVPITLYAFDATLSSSFPRTFCEENILFEHMISSQAPNPKFFALPIDYVSATTTPPAVNFSDSSFPAASNFKTRINKAVENGPNFAGHFVVAEWGCGTSCQQHAVIDYLTGDIIAFGLGSEYGSDFSLDNKILILNPTKNFPELSDNLTPFAARQTFSRLPREYYLLSTTNETAYLNLICTESAAAHYAE